MFVSWIQSQFLLRYFVVVCCEVDTLSAKACWLSIKVVWSRDPFGHDLCLGTENPVSHKFFPQKFPAYFGVKSLGHTIGYKTLIFYLKMKRKLPYLLYSQTKWDIRNVLSFIDALRGFNCIKAVYEHFANPLYTHIKNHFFESYRKVSYILEKPDSSSPEQFRTEQSQYAGNGASFQLFKEHVWVFLLFNLL